MNHLLLKKQKITIKISIMLLVACFVFISSGVNMLYATEVNPAFGNIPEINGANVDESNIDYVYYVDGESNEASDQNSGDEDKPFKTISRAVALALNNNRDNKGTKIIVNPGIYRETVSVMGHGRNNSASIVIEGTDKDSVVIKGSYVMQEELTVSGDYYEFAWNYKWGVKDNVYEGSYDVPIEEIVRRREMIIVDGILLQQVIDINDLSEGKFYIDEEQGKGFLSLPSGVDVNDCVVEIANRDLLVDIQNISNVVLRNITITHGNTFHPGAAVSIYRISNILLENCDINWNNYFGLGFHSAANITFNNISVNNNGGGGIIGSTLESIQIVDSETSGNNWRGMQGDFYDWDTGGIKLLSTDNVAVLRHVANDNYSPGIWFDSNCRTTVIKDSITMRNTSPGESIVAGIYLEGGIGPYHVDNCVMVANRRGVNISSANDVFITNSIIADNETSQFYIFGNFGHGRTFGGVTAFALDSIIENTIISAPEGSTYPFYNFDYNDPGGYVRWYRTLSTKNLQYYHPDPQLAFLLGDAKSTSDISEWQELTGLDNDATWLSERYVFTEPEESSDEEVTLSTPDEGRENEKENDKNKFEELFASIELIHYLLIAGILIVVVVFIVAKKKLS